MRRRRVAALTFSVGVDIRDPTAYHYKSDDDGGDHAKVGDSNARLPERVHLSPSPIATTIARVIKPRGAKTLPLPPLDDNPLYEVHGRPSQHHRATVGWKASTPRSAASSDGPTGSAPQRPPSPSSCSPLDRSKLKLPHERPAGNAIACPHDRHESPNWAIWSMASPIVGITERQRRLHYQVRRPLASSPGLPCTAPPLCLKRPDKRSAARSMTA